MALSCVRASSTRTDGQVNRYQQAFREGRGFETAGMDVGTFATYVVPVGGGPARGALTAAARGGTEAIARGGVEAQAAKALAKNLDIAGLATNGVKFNPDAVLATGRSSAGKVVLLELGNAKARLQHIVVRATCSSTNTVEYWRTREPVAALAGNGPILVRTDGRVVILPANRSVEVSLQEL